MSQNVLTGDSREAILATLCERKVANKLIKIIYINIDGDKKNNNNDNNEHK